MSVQMHLVILSGSPSSKTRTHCTLLMLPDWLWSELSATGRPSPRVVKSRVSSAGTVRKAITTSRSSFHQALICANSIPLDATAFERQLISSIFTMGPDKPSSPLPSTSRAGTEATLTTSTYLSPGLELRGFFTCAYSVSIRCPSLGLWGLALRARQPS